MAGSTRPRSYCPSPIGWGNSQVELILSDGNRAPEVTALGRTANRSGKEPEASAMLPFPQVPGHVPVQTPE